MRNLLIMHDNDFSVHFNNATIMHSCGQNSSQVISSYVSQPHILVYMLNIATCRTCPKAELAPVFSYHGAYIWIKQWSTCYMYVLKKGLQWI